jgi:hypothetical protein
MADQSAIGPDGQLLDASKIAWYNDPDDAQPIQSTSRRQPSASFIHILNFSTAQNVLSGHRSRPVRATSGARLAEAIAAEKLDEFGNVARTSHRRFTQSHNLKRARVKRKRATKDDHATDEEDEDFTSPSAEEGSDDDENDSDVMEISNEEVRLSKLVSIPMN